MNFVNKTAVITGSAKGIGKAVTLKMAELGARLALIDIDRNALDELRDMLGDDHKYYICDISNESDVNLTVSHILDELGKVDILINNAGIFRDGVMPFDKQTSEIWRRKVDINIYGTLYMTHSLIGHMYDQGSGRIVNVGSVAATYGIVNMVDYSMTKGAIVSFTAGLAREAIQHGVYINCVSPGNIASTNVANQPLLSYIGRSGTPEECANVILFLPSDDASYVSGVNYIVDGCRKKI